MRRLPSTAWVTSCGSRSPAATTTSSTRGNNKRVIFLDDIDRLVFLRLLEPPRDEVRLDDLRVLPDGQPLPPGHAHRRPRHVAGDVRAQRRSTRCIFNQSTSAINHLFGRRYWSDAIEPRTSAFSQCVPLRRPETRSSRHRSSRPTSTSGAATGDRRTSRSRRRARRRRRVAARSSGRIGVRDRRVPRVCASDP